MNDAQILSQLFDVITTYRADIKAGPVVNYHPPEQLREKLDLGHKDAPEDYQALFAWVEKYLHYSVKTGHPQFWNRMWVDANMPAMIGEIISTIAHTSACTFESAPVSTEMEKYLIDEFLALAGFEDGEGQMTTGSSNGNLVAMMAARNMAIKTAKTKGLRGAPELVAFVNAEAHYSMDKAANVLGIGTQNVIKVALDGRGQMDMDALESAINAARSAGKIPFFVAATAATTMRGAYDPVARICALRAHCDTDFWVHVDGAWGGTVFLDQALKNTFLPGLEDVDSFTFDFHKMHGIPMICNFLLLNGRKGKGIDIFQDTITSGNDDYIFRGKDNQRPADLGAFSLQCGRHTDVLKLFLAWKFYGRAGFVARIKALLEKAIFAQNLVENAPQLELLAPRTSFNINFRFCAPDGIDVNALNAAIRKTLYESGTAMVGTGTINGQTAIRLLIASDTVGHKDIEDFFAAFIKTGKALIAKRAV